MSHELDDDVSLREHEAKAAKFDANMTKELKERAAGMEKEVVGWIEAITGQSKGDEDFGSWLKSGVVLCNLANGITAGSIKKVNESSMAFKQMENITFFSEFARRMGVPDSSMFATPDLAEARNLGAVVSCIYTLGGLVQVSHPDLPRLGVAINPSNVDKRPSSKFSFKTAELQDECESLRGRCDAMEARNARLLEENSVLRSRAEIDAPHWAKMLSTSLAQLDQAIAPFGSSELGSRLSFIAQEIRDVEAGLRNMGGASLREELMEFKSMYATLMVEHASLQEQLRSEEINNNSGTDAASTTPDKVETPVEPS